MMSIVLYGLLGLALHMAGVSVMTQTWDCIAIIVIVMLIDFVGKNR